MMPIVIAGLREGVYGQCCCFEESAYDMSGNGTHSSQFPQSEGPEFLCSLYEHARVGVLQVASDGRLRWVNPALCRMLGYSQDELLDKAFEDIVPPEDRLRQTKLLRKILTGKYGCYDVEEHFLHRTGTHVSATLTPLLVSGRGPESYCTNIVRDVTESKEASLNFGLIVASAPNPMLMVGENGTVILANSHCESLFGYERGELIHESIETILPGGCALSQSEQPARRRGLFDRKASGHKQLNGCHKRGTTIPVEVNVHAIHFQDHEWMLASITDMTDRNRALQNLQESEERFRTLFNDAPTGMALTSTSGRFIFVNRALCDFLGYSRNELSTKDLLAITCPAAKQATLTQLKQLELGHVSYTRIEERYIHKNGQMLWGDAQRSLIRDSHTGQPKYIFSQIVDITERKRMEESLRETEERFRTIADSAPVFIWMAGVDKSRTYFNRQWLDFTGRSLEEELGNGWIQDIHPQDASRFLASYTQSFDQHQA
ncbi:MAG TPA: PAS domain S-box protein, partial [Terriglobales bacterium]|nr:PAS domain S-box protein [Terriglobales bacterium]